MDRPSVLFDRATAWLVTEKVLLPGASALERLFARIRARAARRLWRALARDVTREQRATAAIGAAQARKAELQAEVAEMQTNRDAWVKAGMLAKLVRCNPGNRPCIRVDEGAGPFESGGHTDYRVIQGY